MPKTILITILLISTVFLAGCFNVSTQAPPPTAGVYKSFDSGNTWMAKNLYVSALGFGDMGQVSVNDIIFDPQDNQALYLLSEGDGIYYSYDGGESWMQPKLFTTGTVNSLAVDPNSKCTIYLTFSNQIYKSTDCSRSFTDVYNDSRPQIAITAIAVDDFNIGIVYAATDSGEVLKSYDSGISWTTIQRLEDKIEKILIDPRDTRTIYIATGRKGIFKTINSGDTWFDLNEGLKMFSASKEYRDLIFIPSKADSLMLLNRYGILKTNDGGQSWEALDLITPPLGADIRTIGVDPQNSQMIYYGTPSTFYWSNDGGLNWTANRLPTGSPASKLIIDPQTPNILYLGFRLIKK